ncbi:uncharacterized protein PV09_05473 [Verruconis gallopava]|uniref:Integral membrane protein n=1 Tax=Verruconis gallopava TaxID=253628 RepID=A0A0D1YRK0_9PEZI|nr:uncharacterized protein PV09_05473 [Verruconis gallopava]KIW03252.1 hypothetical protein PV09_05473 [Verruconis gallopava]
MVDSTANALFQRHPLQRLSSPSRGLSALLHVLGLISFANSFYYLTVTKNPINDSYGWHFQFLTIIGLTISTASFAAGFLADITLSRTLFLLKNSLSVCSAPMEVLISILYWGLRAIDPKLVVPEWAPKLPLSADMGFHAAPAILMVVDLLFFSPPWTIAAAPAMALSSTIAGLYWLWVEKCYEQNKFYPYPIFDEVGHKGRIALFSGSAVVMALATILLKWLYGIVNGTAIANERPGKVKKTS